MMCCCPLIAARRTTVAVFLLALLIATARPSLAQDTCPTATPLAPDTTYAGSSAGATDDEITTLCAPTSRDVWHTFTPAVSGNHTISLCGSGFDTVLALFPACGAAPLACNNDSCGLQSQIVWPLDAGVTYRIRVATRGLDGAGGDYRLRVTSPTASRPSNDVCGTPVSLPLNTPFNATTRGATGDDRTDECGFADVADVWFTFNPTVAGTYIVDVCAEAFDSILSVHNNCLSATLLACNDDEQALGCGAVGSRLVLNPAQGSPVLLRVAGIGGGTGPFTITVHAPRPNDACASAQSLMLDAPQSSFTTIATATEGQPSCGPSGADVWYAFVPTTSAAYRFSLCGEGLDTQLSVFTTCPGGPGSIEVACAANPCGANALSVPLSAGQQYLLRVAGRGQPPAVGAFTLGVTLPPPPNDQCAAAAVLPIEMAIAASTAGASGTDASPCGAADSRDVWFTLTPPVAGTYEISTCGSSIDTVLALFDSCAGDALACNNDDASFCGTGGGSRLTAALQSGRSYVVRVAGVGGLDGNFWIQANLVPQAADACAQARPIVSGLTVAGTTTGATPSGVTPCGSSDTPDLWYAITPASTGYYAFSTCGSRLEATLALYQGCPGPGAIACHDAGATCSPQGGTRLTALLHAGQTYRLRVAATPGSQAAPFRLAVSPASPPNDSCDAPLPLPFEVPTAGSTVRAGGTDQSPCAEGDSADVWFSFRPAATGTYQFHTCAAGDLDAVLSLFASCSEPALACSDDDGVFCVGAPAQPRLVARLEANTIYLLRVAGKGGAQGSFTLIAGHGVPANNTCAAAQAVTEGSYIYDTLGADTDPIFLDDSCPLGFNLLSKDIWYRYTPAAPGQVTVSLCGSSFDTALAIAVASGGCPGGLMTPAACNNDFDCDNNPATPDVTSQVTFTAQRGTPYFIRLGSRFPVGGSGVMVISRQGGTCPCDWNLDGRLEIADIFAFLRSWFAGNADFDGDSQTAIADIFAFLRCFLGSRTGC